MNCDLDRCFDQPAFQCMPTQCPCVLAAPSVTQTFLAMSTCLLQNCGTDAGVCPQFKE
jgi:hypothetical protein